ncbi:type 1 glutamine amidotransferase domain-containing protein [Bacteroides sp.]|uniref:type 1 glutamine amidotransferase domain-containing protein n=1 Tax=Bacteroides sp. TaxID=29523 RepID=UPI002622094A|nr:type 1 glutamine amidotransferase domain-containing protein [Bacteroides sp.]
MKILIIVTSAGIFVNRKLATGLWLSEFTHIYHSAKENGYDITLANPKGGYTPVDPESLKPFLLDEVSKKYWENPDFKEMLDHANRLDDVLEQQFDCVYLAGGHGAMYDFPDNAALQAIIKKQYESGRMMSAICHGVSGLLNVKLSNGEYMIKGKSLTGFSWFEESLAKRKEDVPFDLEALLKERGVDYKKALIPMTSKVVVDNNLITGQNPFSSKEMAKVIMQQLKLKQ